MARKGPNFAFETEAGAKDGRLVIGVDEAGRGPLAGPVVAAAVWLPPAAVAKRRFKGIKDSKLLTPELRAEFFQLLRNEADVAIGVAGVEEIDRHNILRASLLAMSRAAAGLSRQAEFALVDGDKAPDLACACRTVIKGDGLSLSIAAASIAAKVTRDAMMGELAGAYPVYGWERNRGYGTAEHCAAIKAHGISPEHRRSFRPVHEALQLTL